MLSIRPPRGTVANKKKGIKEKLFCECAFSFLFFVEQKKNRISENETLSRENGESENEDDRNVNYRNSHNPFRTFAIAKKEKIFFFFYFHSLIYYL